MRRRDFLKGCTCGPIVGAWPYQAAAQGPPLRMASFSSLTSFDPAFYRADSFIMRAVFPPLTRVTRQATDPLIGWEAYAATPSPFKEEGSRQFVELTAEPDRKWSNGNPNTIADIVRGLERARKTLLKGVSTIEVRDNRSCRLYFDRRDLSLYKEAFARPPTTPLTDAAESALGRHARYEHALGPYRFVDPFQPGDVVTLAANPHWASPRPAVTMITVRRYDDVNSALAHFQAGQLDLVVLPGGRIRGRDIFRELGIDTAEVRSTPLSSVTYIGMNVNDGPTSDQRVREAIRAAISTTAVTSALFGERGARATSEMLPAALLPEPVSPDRWHAPTRVRNLLAEAGFRGSLLTILVAAQNLDQDGPLAEAVKGQLEQVNLRAEIEVVDVTASVRPRRDQATLFVGRTPLSLTPTTALATFTSNAPANLPRFSHPEYDLTVARLAEGGSPELLGAARGILNRSSIGVPIYQETMQVLTRRGLRTRFAADGTLGDLVDFSWG
ncbi:MAG: ABC transporter substrate-binding protein [Hyphomicrobiales bacterium]|nr:MAG: ABC transporter substrate-binding protein [Hyphomicrobiales bacterium]